MAVVGLSEAKLPAADRGAEHKRLGDAVPEAVHDSSKLAPGTIGLSDKTKTTATVSDHESFGKQTGPEFIRELFDLKALRDNQEMRTDSVGIVQGAKHIAHPFVFAATKVDKIIKTVQDLAQDSAAAPQAYTKNEKELIEVMDQAVKLGIKNPFRFIALTSRSDGEKLNLSSSKNILDGMLNPDYTKPLISYFVPTGGVDVFSKTLGTFLSDADRQGYRVHYSDIATTEDLTKSLKIATNNGKNIPVFTVIAGHGSPYSVQFGESELHGKASEKDASGVFLTRMNVKEVLGDFLSGSQIFLQSCSTAGKTDDGENMALSLSKASNASMLTAFGIDNNCMLSLLPDSRLSAAMSLPTSNRVYIPLGTGLVRVSAVFHSREALMQFEGINK